MTLKMKTRNSMHTTLKALSLTASISTALVLATACDEQPVFPVQSNVQANGGQVLIGAGDIADCTDSGDEQTADLVDSLLVEHPGALVFTAGDNSYEDGTAEEYARCYEPSWGRFKDRTWATTGNHDYDLGNADPTFDYFGERAGPRGLGYYSLDVGNWHLVMLNSNSGFVPLDEGSAQNRWLRQDLAANTNACVLAVFHHPRFNSCRSGTGCNFVASRTKPLWEALYEYGADLIINGHLHHYERFSPQDPEGNPDPDSGIREFIVGTGGGSLFSPRDVQAPNSEALNDEAAFGVIKLTLHDDASYEWEFIPVPGSTYTDSGSGRCHTLEVTGIIMNPDGAVDVGKTPPDSYDQ
jgi:hypothetical protein